jgi:pimeloyl-ACP methyl ester carboxylesterase
MKLRKYQIIHKLIQQPIDHADPDGPKLDQRVSILIPEGAPLDSPVFFNLGNETELTDDDLIDRYKLHGDKYEIIYVQAEHRGYGQSLSYDEDQTVPSYVRIDQAIADAHEVIQTLKKDYPGPWMISGWSYGGGLAINFGVAHPADVSVILCSSGVVDWPFLNVAYERQVRKAFRKSTFRRLLKHSKNLGPNEPFDKNWIDREFLRVLVIGFTQMGEFKRLRPIFEMLTLLPTRLMLKILKWTDKKQSEDQGMQYALSLSKKTLTREEAATGKYGWRVWRYQQCTETGVFFSSEGEEVFFSRTPDDIRAECQALFEMEPPYGEHPTWSPRAMLDRLQVPLIYVSGGQDPWLALGLEPGYETKYGKYFFVPDAHHGPDRDDPHLARQVLDEMIKYSAAKK